MNDKSMNEAQLSSTYLMAPMDYINMYTNENIRIGKAPQPPPPLLLKDTNKLVSSLEDQGIEQIYPKNTSSTATNTTSMSTNDHKKELKKLNHSILIAYLDLLDVLIKAPMKEDEKQQQQQTFKTLRDQKLEDIELLFINMHHLINELRPHQARDNIRCILEMQKKQRIEAAQKFRTFLLKIVEILKICINASSSSSKKKSDIFIDELNSMMAKTTVLTKHLDTIEFFSNKKILKNIISDNNNVNSKYKSLDIDMLQDFESSIKLIHNNIAKNIKQENANSFEQCKTTSPNNSNNNNNNDCDFKDLILCNLIDDFLLKENEF